MWPSLKEIAQSVEGGETTALELVEKSLKKIKAGDDWNVVLAVSDHAKTRANQIDEQVSKGEKIGPLAGIPFIAKDNFLTKDTETTASSNILGGFNPPFSATAIEKLEEAGAIMVAKANLDAFAHGSSTENSDFGPTKNPHDKTRVPGGSSGGSAASVVLGMAPFAIGTDTGGSIRLPASFCGVVGYKPTYGLVSRYGVIAMASSTDVIGPIANTVDDTALVLEVMSGKDPRDSTTIDRDEAAYTDLDTEISGKTFGVIKQHMGDGVETDVKQSMDQAMEAIKKSGGKFKAVDIPSLDLALAVYYIVMPAEVSSNLSRYDGVRYGYSHEDAKTVDQVYDLSRTFGFNDEVKRRIMIGTYVLSSGYYDAYYKRAQAVRTLLIKEYDRAMEGIDCLVGPTSPTVAFKLGENVQDPLSMYLTDIMTVGMNLVGTPAISLPASSSGMPIGLQLAGAQHEDRKVLGIAKGVERLLGDKQ